MVSNNDNIDFITFSSLGNGDFVIIMVICNQVHFQIIFVEFLQVDIILNIRVNTIGYFTISQQSDC